MMICCITANLLLIYEIVFLTNCRSCKSI